MKLTRLITALLFLVSIFSGNTYAQRNIETIEKGGDSLKVKHPVQKNLTIMTANGKM